MPFSVIIATFGFMLNVIELTHKHTSFYKKSSAAWYCIKCSEEIYPFLNISNEELFETNQGKNIKFKVFTKKSSKQNIDLIDKLNKAMDDPDSETMTAKYYEPDEIPFLLSGMSPNISFFHLNISSLTFHFEELIVLMAENKLNFDFLGISETRLKLNRNSLNPISMPGYNIEHTPTESSNGGTLLYIKQGINYKLRKDLQIYKSKELESTFVEVLEPGMSKNNMIIGCIYRHPSMELSEFNNHFLSVLLEKISKENKMVVLLGDFNADLLKYDHDEEVSGFLDAMYSKLLLPNISSPTRITSTSATLIDNIFTNDYDNAFTSGHLLTTLSDHLAQILIVPIRNTTRHKEPKKVHRDFQKILRNKDIISRYLQNTNWDMELQLNLGNINISTEKFISKINNLINDWAPLKELSNAKQKLQNKPWITKGILKSIKNKNKQYRKMCRTKDLTKRKKIEQEFKTYKNYLLKITRTSKFKHYNNYFQENRLNLFKTWEGIRDIINITKKSKNNINSIQVNGRDITDPAIIANEFNNHFTTIAKQIEAKLITPNSNFSNHLSEPVEETLTFRATDKLEVTSIISSLNARKAFGPASIPNNFLKLFKN